MCLVLNEKRYFAENNARAKLGVCPVLPQVTHITPPPRIGMILSTPIISLLLCFLSPIGA